MTKPVVQTVFVIDLKRVWRPIKELRAEITSGPKMTWALFTKESLGGIGHAYYGKRKLLGKSAFFTRKDAESAKLGRLRASIPQFEKLMRLPWHIAPSADISFEKVKAQIAEYEQTGTIH